MSAAKPSTAKGLVTAAQCLQNFSTEMLRAEAEGRPLVDTTTLDERASHQTFQQAPLGKRATKR